MPAQNTFIVCKIYFTHLLAINKLLYIAMLLNMLATLKLIILVYIMLSNEHKQCTHSYFYVAVTIAIVCFLGNIDDYILFYNYVLLFYYILKNAWLFSNYCKARRS